MLPAINARQSSGDRIVEINDGVNLEEDNNMGIEEKQETSEIEKDSSLEI
jgi:hypothetical protein